MPKPTKNETKEDYLKRCMGDSQMTSEFPDEKQRYAVCENYYTEMIVKEVKNITKR